MKRQTSQASATHGEQQDPPKKPPSAYNLYFKKTRPLLIHNHSTGHAQADFDANFKAALKGGRVSESQARFQAASRTLADRWKAMSNAERQPFEKEAKEEAKKYDELMMVYDGKRLEAMLRHERSKKTRISRDNATRRKSQPAAHAASSQAPGETANSTQPPFESIPPLQSNETRLQSVVHAAAEAATALSASQQMFAASPSSISFIPVINLPPQQPQALSSAMLLWPQNQFADLSGSQYSPVQEQSIFLGDRLLQLDQARARENALLDSLALAGQHTNSAALLAHSLQPSMSQNATLSVPPGLLSPAPSSFGLVDQLGSAVQIPGTSYLQPQLQGTQTLLRVGGEVLPVYVIGQGVPPVTTAPSMHFSTSTTLPTLAALHGGQVSHSTSASPVAAAAAAAAAARRGSIQSSDDRERLQGSDSANTQETEESFLRYLASQRSFRRDLP